MVVARVCAAGVADKGLPTQSSLVSTAASPTEILGSRDGDSAMGVVGW